MAGKSRKPGGTAIATRSADGEVLEPAEPVSDKVVEEAYVAISKLQRSATIDLAVQTGKVIVDKFYKGDLAAFRKHGPKEASLKKLADRFEKAGEDAPVSAAALYRCLAVYELDKRLHVSARKHLTLTHLHAVMGLPADEQKRLLDLAEEKEMTTRQLEDKAKASRKKAGDGRGRPPLPAFLKTLNALGRLAIREDAFGDLEDIDTLDDDEAEGAIRAVTGMRERLDEIEIKLNARRNTT